ncbi:MAG: dTMP kinase [Patescibacteria group bacterium]
MSQRPFFVALEGIDGSGKDTLAVRLEEHFVEKHNLEVAVTEEPTQGSIGVLIRRMLDGEIPAPSANIVFQALFIEDRAFHIQSLIRPKLLRNNLVISVRYWLSTIAYGMLDGTAAEYIAFHRRVVGEELIVPDLTIILDLETEETMRRIQAAGRKFDWFAKKEKLERIRQNYLELAKSRIAALGTIVVVDAMKSKEEVALDAEAAIERWYLMRIYS